MCITKGGNEKNNFVDITTYKGRRERGKDFISFALTKGGLEGLLC